MQSLIAAGANTLSLGRVHGSASQAAQDRYMESLLNPFDVPDAKVPSGFPTQSTTVQIKQVLPFNILSSTQFSVGSTTYTLNNGSPIAFFFQPFQGFDTNDVLQLSYNYTTSGYTVLVNWQNISPVNAWGANYSSVRLVSAGIR